MKRIVSLILILVIICLSISPALAAEEDEEEVYSVNESVMAYYIWLLLSSWGISINTGTPAQYNQTIEDKIIDWVMEYLETLPSAYTISTWIAPWQASMDYWGNFQGNASMLEDVEDFGEWLINFLALTDDDTVTINPIETLNGIQLFKFNEYYLCDSVGGEITMIYMETSTMWGESVPRYWFVAYNTDNNTYQIVFLNSVSGSKSLQSAYYNASAVRVDYQSQSVYINSGPVAGGYYYSSYGSWTPKGIPEGANYYSGTWTEFQAWMQNASIIVSGDLDIITSEIELPTDNPSYTPGDSITIVDNEPGYSVINFPDNLKVSNLPAIISEGAVPDPQFSGVFAPVSALISAMVPAITIVQGIAFELPDIMITFFLAMCGCLIFFGFVRKMME